MTDQEDDFNAAMNKIMSACFHVPVTIDGRRVYCLKCKARFALVLLPRKARPIPMYWDDLDGADTDDTEDRHSLT